MGCTNSKPVAASVEEARPILSSERELQHQELQKQRQQQGHQQQLQQQQFQKEQENRQPSGGIGAASDRSLGMADSFDATYDKIVHSNDNSNRESSRTYHSSGNTRSNLSSISAASVSSMSVQAPEPTESTLIKQSIYEDASEKDGRSSSQPSTSDKQLSSVPTSQSDDISISSTVVPPPPPPPAPPANKDEGAIDPHWEYLFTTLSPHILDPEDLPSTLDATISKMINNLSPAEVSFIRRRVKDSIRTTIANEGNGDEKGSTSGIVGSLVGSGGSEGKRSSLSKKVGRLVGYSSSNDKTNSTMNTDISIHSLHPALDESVDRVKSSKSVFQKERLMDITTLRKIFEGGECSLRALRASVKAELSDNNTGTGNNGSSTSITNIEPYRRRSIGKAGSSSIEQQDAPLKSVEQRDKEAIEKIDVYGSAFLLLVYISEIRWDYVTEIAKLSSKEAGLTLDVNKLALQEQEEVEGKNKNGSSKKKLNNQKSAKIPLPPRPPSFTPPSEFYNVPDLTINEPGGIRFTSLCFLIAMALRGTRRQKLSLLFYLLLPPKELNSVLASHPAGGLPTWLLEMDEDVVFSYDSLSYYYNYDGVLLPSAEHKINNSSSQDRKQLCIDATSSVEVLATLLVASMGKDDSPGGAYGTQRLTQRLIELLRENNVDTSDQSSKEVNTLSSMKCQGVRETLLQASQDGGEKAPPSAFSETEIDQIGDFAELSSALSDNASLPNGEAVRLAWSMHDFVEWAEVAMDEIVLDNIMRSLFGTGILPPARMERQLVAQRWIDWNLQYMEDHPTTTPSDTGPPTPLRGGLRKIFTNHESENPSDEATGSDRQFNQVWGGIGGVDGMGGLGYGVLYCIDKQWWDKWVAFTGWTLGKSGQFSSPSSLKRPRELSTERLIDRSTDTIFVSGSRGSYEIMKQNAVLGTNYVLVPPGVWNVLYEIYGGGPPLPRMVLPSNGSNEAHINGVGGRVVSVGDESVEVISPGLQGPSIDIQHYPKEIPESVRVATHPWVLHCQICDPQQPYRRGDAGPMSIRIMTMPDQPLWRLFAEIVVRLPIGNSKARDSQGEGRARLWRFEVANGKVPNPSSSFGPWVLLCKNRFAEIPISSPSYDKYKERWESYADQHSAESIGISDGMRLMIEYAVANKDGKFTWPREAAAKATAKRRIADEDASFRLLLRGLDMNGEPLKTTIMRKAVDAMDSSGRWYQAIIVNVDTVAKVNEPDSNGDTETTSNEWKSDGTSFRENTHVRVHFKDHTESHQEWIDVKSDHLAVRGRMTSSSMRHLESEHGGDEATSTSESKSRIAAGIKKKDTDATTPDTNSTAVCLFPSYGACGLINLGNTCYANSGWQCMSYLPLLRSFLLSGQFKIYGDMNRDNPLGTGGKILEEFSELLHFMWSGKYGARAPQKFRSFLAKCRSQYSGADQQDAQELLNDMFDMLHEDGNRVKKKPYVEALEDKFIEKTDLSRVGQEAWRRFLRRNRSVISDLSMGQVYNRVTCPECNHSSKNFDPFNMLSLPFPTVAEVIFQCTVVRRASALNCPNTMSSIGKRHQQKDKPKSSTAQTSPPSKELIFEEYLIPMSRLADLGDLKLKLQNLSGISAKDLRVCKKEVIATEASDTRSSFTKIYTKVSALPDKEGPCVKLLQQASLDDVSSPTIAKIIAFESTLVVRPIQLPTNERQPAASRVETTDDASTTADEMSTDSSSHVTPVYQNKAEENLVQEYLKVYGDEQECVVFDTNPTPLTKVISRSLWPKSTKDFTLGLRVDAIDHRNHWFPGSVIEIVVAGTENNPDGEGDVSQSTTKVKIHFDNFSAKWDEMYSIDHFTQGRVCPLYSHATPRPKPTEFIVHHRGLDRKSKKCYLFGQSFYIQCHNEWSTARAGAHILAQASRFLETFPFQPTENGKKLDAVDRKIAEKEKHEARKVISRVIEALIKSDRKYVESAINSGRDVQKKEEHTPFDVSVMSQILSKKLSEVLPLLPFDVRVTTANAPLGTNEEESPFPFSLVRTIGNYMNARHSLVLHWRDKSDNLSNSKSSNKKHSDGPRHFLYSPPFIASHKQSRGLLNSNQKDTSGNNAIKRHPSSSHGGLHIGVCLTEFCKEQQLDATGCWRCPVCKAEREGKQSMTLWNLPDLLTFHLKRFNASSRWREKISTKVDFPLTGLNMREWCDAESPLCQESDDDAFIYDLVGVVNHYGGMTGGHYVAMCKATACSADGDEEVAYNFNGAGISDFDSAEEEAAPSSGWRTLGRSKEKDSSSNAAAKAVTESAEPLWLQFDDDLVEPLPPRNVVSEASYVLFYRRRRMHPANIAKYSSLG
ncbi:hypothetical protein ACHAXR_010719 [Thalassiosira sp. AJA248-18]